ncbi:ABC transporter ATP-binding protein [Fuscibacter oryzae]|uniref:ABC transporter ATP-binding protein n=1 Tax=Fuscibacter oryzae TaxID=2803939 RepID=A0A8J7SVT9_9RHOB|nr:ABC transporter ATP-binding protein [Fuscibacter oryzae]MBL4928164.1 ABC transporter ATP-binding protein [Fuscibacter oryzae]
MSFITLQNIQKSFGATQVVRDFSLGIEKGEFISLLGPSGCGKTTVLRMLAGFEGPTSGQISIDGQDMTGLPANRRRIGMVFQSYALFPNLTVAENVAFGLKVTGTPRSEAAKRVEEMLGMVGLGGFGARYPFQLSGGQQQRVALARAIAPRPRVLLLDEPLSALDAKIRISLRSEIRAIQRELGITTLFVTHDQEEAMSMSDRVVVMYGGRAEQVGAPSEIYNRPASRFVAEFIGSLNLLPGTITDAAAGLVETPAGAIALGRTLDQPTGTPVSLAIRPEGLHMGYEGNVVLNTRVADSEFLGSIIRLRVMTGGNMPLIIARFNREGQMVPQPGQDLTVSVNASDIIVLDGRAA